MSDKITNCVVCSHPITENDFYLRRNFEGFDCTLDLYQCPGCKVVRVAPMVSFEDIASVYSVDYIAYQQKDLKALMNSWNRKLRMIEKHIEGDSKKLLEIGSGTGDFLLAAKLRGWNVKGLELSEYAAREANRLLGEEVVETGRVEDTGLESESYDVVYLKAVLEHMIDPVVFIKKAWKSLRAGGLLVICGIPNVDSFACRMQRANWSSFHSPDHVVFFSPDSLSVLLRDHGFKMLEHGISGMPPTNFKRGEIVNFDCRRKDGQKSESQKRNWIGTLKRTVLRNYAASMAMTWVINLLKFGDTFYVIYRKDSDRLRNL